MRALLAAMAVVLVASVAVVGVLRVNEYAVDLTVEADGSLTVVETLVVEFLTQHHGIIRSLPVSYRRPTGERFRVTVDLLSITVDDAAVPWTATRSGGELRFRIGDPNVQVTGIHVYRIDYVVRRALLFRDDYVQLYWNVVGTKGGLPTQRAVARVWLPATVDPYAVPTTSYIGYAGSAARGGAATVDERGALVFETGSLAPGEGLTIDVAIPREASGLVPPSVAQRVGWFLRDNAYAGLPIVALLGMVVLWWRKGRDPTTGAIAPAFAPPEGMHAGEVGVLVDDRADLRDISAMVIGLAVGGYLEIEATVEQDGSERAPRGPQRFTFRRLRTADGLSPAERTLFDAIFDEEHADERSLSSLENRFYKALPEIKSRIYGGLIERGCYPHNPERVRSAYLTGGALLAAAGVGLGVLTRSLYLGISLACCGGIVAAFARLMPRKTSHGAVVLREVRGLAEYIERAEVDRIEFHDAPEKSPELFEKLLPYAMALDLTRIWTQQFEGLFREPPRWYVGGGPVFHGHLFATSMLHLSAGMNRTFASAPRTASTGRSAWGGRSSFGGGFSGGGFGGGGVSGW